MKRLVYAIIIIMVCFHFDFWNWDKIHPIVFGWIPIGLFYHIAYCFLFMGVIHLLNRFCWRKPPETF